MSLHLFESVCSSFPLIGRICSETKFSEQVERIAARDFLDLETTSGEDDKAKIIRKIVIDCEDPGCKIARDRTLARLVLDWLRRAPNIYRECRAIRKSAIQPRGVHNCIHLFDVTRGEYVIVEVRTR